MKITKPSDLKAYLHGLFNGRPGDAYPRIQHSGVTPTTVMSVMLNAFAVADDDSLVVREHNGRETNTAWFTVRQKDRYAVVYHKGTLDLRERSLQGRTIATFTDTNTDRIWPVFSTL